MERYEEVFEIILKEFGVVIEAQGNATSITTTAQTIKEHVNDLADLASLQCKIFNLLLKLESAVSKNSGRTDPLVTSKHFYEEMMKMLNKIFHTHMELMLDDGIVIGKREENEHT